jgi:hypothetical protein
MKKALALTVTLLTFILASYMSNNLRKPSTEVAFALGEIESCDSAGNTVNEFNPGDPVYVKGSSLEPGSVYYIYIVRDYSSWMFSETHISDLHIVEGPITVDVAADGSIENQPVRIWDSASPGYYDIWADSQTDGETDFYDEFDAIDNLDVNDAGFLVIIEVLFVTIPVVTIFFIIMIFKKRNTACKKSILV